MARVFAAECGATSKAPAWAVSLLARAAGAASEATRLSLHKYAWQFGTTDFRTALTEIPRRAVSADLRRLRCPSLFLVGDAESAELRRQAREVFETMTTSGASVTLKAFGSEEGGDSHCQVDNFRLAHETAFGWLERTLGVRRETDPRMLV